MATTTRVTNRGPAAAADNRRALMAAARRLFAEHGYHVAYSAIAREAGVGQGSLYRHFPSRLDLAFAIFEENLDELEGIAVSHPGADGFSVLWRRLVEHQLASSALVEMVVDARRELDDTSLARRLLDTLREPLARAHAAGLVDRRLTVEDLALAQRMVHGVIVTETDPERARSAALRALAMIDPALSWTDRAEPQEDAS